MKTLIIIILIIIAIGLYFVPGITKSIVKTTGSVVVDAGKEGIEMVKESETVKNVTKEVKDKIVYEIIEE